MGPLPAVQEEERCGMRQCRSGGEGEEQESGEVKAMHAFPYHYADVAPLSFILSPLPLIPSLLIRCLRAAPL